jgi:Sulfatase
MSATRTLGLACLCLLAACDGLSEHRSSWPRTRLTDVAALERGTGEAEAIAVGTDTRYVLNERVPVALPLQPRGGSSTRTADAQGRVRVRIACPRRAAGDRMLVELRLTRLREGAVDDVVEKAPFSVTCSQGTDPSATVVRAGLTPGLAYGVSATGIRSPAARVPSAWTQVEAGSTLRLALAIAAVGVDAAGPPIPYTIVVEDEHGRRLTLARGEVSWRDGGSNAWHEVEVPLDRARAWIGSTLRFVFEAPVEEGPTGGVRLVAWGDPQIWSPRRRADTTRPNLVLVSLDTLRADRLGIHGYPLDISPNLDAFGRQGTIFERASSVASWTTPAHAAMLTGTFSCVHHIGGANKRKRRRSFPRGVTPLAEILRRRGWVTAAFTENAYVDPIAFQRGFGFFRADTGKPSGDAGGRAPETIAAATAWLQARGDEPFLLFVHTYEVHQPYRPPEWAQALVPDPLPVAAGAIPPTAEQREQAAAYVGEVANLDRVMGQFFAALDALALTERTIVVVTSDHGEAFGEHGTTGHGFGLAEEELWVPLMVRAPGRVVAGRSVPEPVALVDVAPTVLDLLGIPIPQWIQGVSLARQLVEPHPPRVPLGRVFPMEGFARSGMRGDLWKIMERPHGAPYMVRLDRDPREESPQPVPSALLARGRTQLSRSCESSRRLVETAGTPRLTPAEPESKRRRKLRALGYLDSEPTK